ncbi:hypothetical protein ABZX40_13375 [Streptomyces sp. NPDC004610]|uniref:hypothetical protein n=1 Tax=unclassified Streptomyces TaxID=2593676 RepID=UPI0033B65826
MTRPTASTITDTQLDRLYARLDSAEAALERVRTVVAHIRAGAAWTRNPDEVADRLSDALDPAPGPAADSRPAPTQPDPDPLVVREYRADDGTRKWVFRCWGTDTCDGALSLDHTSQQWAERARDRHLAEEPSMDDDRYEDFEHTDVPDDYCPFHPRGGCTPDDHFPAGSATAGGERPGA